MEQQDALLNQYENILCKNHDIEEMDASTTLKRDNRSPSPLDKKETNVTVGYSPTAPGTLGSNQTLDWARLACRG